MANMQWEDRIGRRLKLRDLHVLFAVVQWGSMAKAAKHLSISQPVVSKAIAELESMLGVRLLDVKNDPWVLLQQPIDDDGQQTGRNPLRTADAQLTDGGIGKELDFPHALP